MNMSKAAWFLAGATLGSACGVGVTYLYLKDKFERKLNDEVVALKAHYVERDRELAKKNDEIKKDVEGVIFSEVSDYHPKTDMTAFADYANMYTSSQTAVAMAPKAYNEVIEKNEDISSAAEIISDSDFDDPEYDSYKKVSVDYFEDGAAFESLSGESLDGFESVVGEEFKTAFGEYTPNVVYVRNHELKTDYEIIEQEGSHPHPEDE